MSNLRDLKILYYLYKITNKLNDKTYYGVHRTTNVNDGYMGSGTLITKAIKKYGVNNFEKVILEFFSCVEDMFQREKEIINENVVSSRNNYNIKLGGNGGFDHINDNPIQKQAAITKTKITIENKPIEEKERINSLKRMPGIKNPMFGSTRFGNKNPMFGKKQSEYCRSRCSETNKGMVNVKDNNGVIVGKVSKDHPNVLSGLWVNINKYKTHTEEWKLNRSEQYKQRGIKPPSPKGMLWWNNGKFSMRSKDKPEGDWIRGRIPFQEKTKNKMKDSQRRRRIINASII